MHFTLIAIITSHTFHHLLQHWVPQMKFLSLGAVSNTGHTHMNKRKPCSHLGISVNLTKLGIRALKGGSPLIKFLKLNKSKIHPKNQIVSSCRRKFRGSSHQPHYSPRFPRETLRFIGTNNPIAPRYSENYGISGEAWVRSLSPAPSSFFLGFFRSAL